MPIITPGQVNQTAATQASSSAQAARARAIAMLSQGSAAEPQVANQNSIAPEEMSAVKPPSQANAAENATPGETKDGQSTTNEASSTEGPKEATKAKEEPLSSQYAQLARKEKALRVEAQRLKAEREALKVERDAAAKAKEVPQIDQSQYVPKERLTKETLAVLSELGISYDQLTQMALNAPSPETQAQQAVISELKAEIQAIKDANKAVKQTFEDSQKQNYDSAVNQIRIEAKQLISANPEFETIKQTGSTEDVVNLIERTFHEGLGDDYPKGTLLTVEQAAQMVEDHLVEEAVKIASLSKIQQRLKPAQAAAPKQEPPKQSHPAPKTLTNAVGSSRQMSARERAILAFKGELKS